MQKILKILSDNKNLKILSHCTQEQHDTLKSNFDGDTLTLIEKVLKATSTSSQGRRYSEELEKFAVTLHFYNSQAYDYMGKLLSLPHPSTIQKWAKSREYNPGFLSEVLETLKSTLQPDTKDVAIMFDCMHLKKGFTYDSGTKTYIGSVNLGHLNADDNDTPAGQMLTLMVVGPKKHFKQPIGYYFIDKVTADTQAQMVKDSLISWIFCSCCFCDGCYTNQSTAIALGCSLNPFDMKTAFPHPINSENVYFVFGACHLIKNVRNCLGDLKTLFHQEEEIQWEHIAQLDKVQREDNLFLANIIIGKNIRHEKNKMNVKFAVQTISSSVDNAIDFLRDDLSLPAFAGSSGTTNFIRIFDKMFDYCNSSSSYGKGTKSPIMARNISIRENKMKDAVLYIIFLKDATGKLLIHGKRKTCFIGFICTLLSILALSKTFLTHFKFFMTYRISQDHREMFFSRIRRKNGWNNNPTLAQFKWSLGALLKNGVLPSAKANYIYTEEPSDTKVRQPGDTPISSAATTCKDLQHFIQAITKPSINHDQAFYYISGFISRKVADRLECSKCVPALLVKDHGNPCAVFTLRSSIGGLLMSDDMFTVIKEADTYLHQILVSKDVIDGVDQHLIPSVTKSVLQAVSTTVFADIWSHSSQITNLETEDCHVHQLIKEACKIFCHTFVHHHVRLFSDGYIFKDSGTQRHTLKRLCSSYISNADWIVFY